MIQNIKELRFEVTMLQNIKDLYKEVKAKTEFIKAAADDLNKSPLTLRQHWFGNFWSIPEEHQPRVVELLQNTLLTQNQKKNAKA